MDRMNDRVVLRIAGADRIAFLQGLVTNDMGRLEADGIVYAALLTPQGKYLADFFVMQAPDGAVLLDIAAPLAADTLRRLTMYRLRADVTITPTTLGIRRGTGPAPDGALADPRHPALGWRMVVEGPPAEPAGAAIDWDAIRVAHCIPESGAELIPGESYILECGFERLNGVDFRKGCYVGQEVTARMKHKTELRKGLVCLRIEGQAEPGAEILSQGRPAGRLHTRAGDRAIAWLRHDRMAPGMTAGAARLDPC